jgi:hypothetical protein
VKAGGATGNHFGEIDQIGSGLAIAQAQYPAGFGRIPRPARLFRQW